MKNIALFLMQLTVGKQTRAKLSISESTHMPETSSAEEQSLNL